MISVSGLRSTKTHDQRNRRLAMADRRVDLPFASAMIRSHRPHHKKSGHIFGEEIMKRRTVLQAALTGTAALTLPRAARAQAPRKLSYLTWNIADQEQLF